MGRHNDKALEMAVVVGQVQGEMRCAHTRWSCLRTQPFLRLWEDVGYDGWKPTFQPETVRPSDRQTSLFHSREVAIHRGVIRREPWNGAQFIMNYRHGID
ncbi:hypothetical protein IAQ61_001109 [Plenodomus lingam]|uniref:uncharacterized protein n=1 Tax=Leptosphaeria maculans TaxID=5022 RepID=UPI0033279B73|nr:hypothetical protein IAQ61_001109 [Plenodomus lingam]